MKLIDFALVFSIIFISVITVVNLKNDLLYKNVMDNAMYDKYIDEVVIDSLSMGFIDIKDQIPIVEKELISECYMSEMSMLYTNSIVNKEYGANYTILIYTTVEGFYTYNNGQWSEIIKYTKGEDTKHEIKIKELEEYLLENFNVKILTPTNDGESFKNTVKDFSLLAIYKCKRKIIDGDIYGVYSFSGAAIISK